MQRISNIHQQMLAIKKERKKEKKRKKKYPSFKVIGKYFTISTLLKVTLVAN